MAQLQTVRGPIDTNQMGTTLTSERRKKEITPAAPAHHHCLLLARWSCVQVGAVSELTNSHPPSGWGESATLRRETGRQTLLRAQDRRRSARGERVAEDKA